MLYVLCVKVKAACLTLKDIFLKHDQNQKD